MILRIFCGYPSFLKLCKRHLKKPLGNGDYFVIIASSTHLFFLTEHAVNGLVEAPLK